MQLLSLPAHARLKDPHGPLRTPWLQRVISLVVVGWVLLALCAVSPAQAASVGQKPPHKLTAAQIQAVQQILKKQIHVTPTETSLGKDHQPFQPFRPLRPQLSNQPAYNNVGISDVATRLTANFDSFNRSYSAQALQDVGLVPGITMTSQNVTFLWPSVAPGQADNYLAAGQVIPVSAVPGAATVGFLGAADIGSASGTATLTYTDGSTTTFTLDFTDWWNGTLQPGNVVAVQMSTINTAHGTKSGTFDLYSFTTSLNTSKTLQSVTLPTTISGGQLHVFAVGTSGPAFNNIGVSDDSSPGTGSYDTGGNSYSAQALQSVDIVSGHQFDSDGIAYMWPSAASGQVDNDQANGQIIPVIPVPNATTVGFLGSAANGNASGTATLTFTDGTTQLVTLGFTDWAVSTLAFGNVTVATMSYRNGGGGKQNITSYLFTTEFTLTSGKTLQSVTLPSTVTGGSLHVFAVGTRSILNNVAFSNDSQPGGGNMDNSHNSYSIQALEAAGITPGQAFSYDGTTFTLPASYGSLADNSLVNGQTLPVTPVANATTLIILGASDYNNESGTATITYTDSSTQTFTLNLSDWMLSSNTQPVAFGNGVVATMSYAVNNAGKGSLKAYIFSTEISLQPAKTVQSVTLPTSISPSSGQMHVFTIGTRAQYNNTAISDDSNTAGANFDGLGNSYSEEDFTNPNVAGWNPGDTLTYEGINYVWPGVPAGQGDDYNAMGQTIPINAPVGATTLGLVGAAGNAFPSSTGTATLTYTDGTTSTFTLGFSDWALNGGSATPLAYNRLFALLPHRNTPQGQQAVTTYLFEMETPLNASKTLQSVTLPSAVSQGTLHVFMMGTRTGENYPNNVGSSDDSDTVFASFDGDSPAHSYSIEGLEAQGLSEGQPFTFNGVTFTWPSSFSVIPDNYQAAGQVIPVTHVLGATTLAFLGASTNTAGGNNSGAATITYTDGSTQAFTLSFTDWWSTTAQSGNQIVATCSFINTPTGQQTQTVHVYYTDVALQTSKTIQSVTLPSTVSSGQMHVFAVGTKGGQAPTSASVTEDTDSDFHQGTFSGTTVVGTGPSAVVQLATAAAGPNGTQYKRAITLNNTANTNSLSNYQISFTLDTASLISAGKLRSDCGDMRINASDDVTPINTFWVENCNSSTTIVWVKVPSIPASATQTIYLYYGNSAATSLSSVSQTFLRDIPNTLADWPMHESAGTSVADATGDGYTGTATTTTGIVAGQFGNARSFNGSAGFIQVANEATLPFGTSARTVCAWALTNSLSGTSVIFATGSTNTDQFFGIGRNNADLVGFGWNDDLTAANFFTTGTWNQVCLSYDGTTATLYGNGVQLAQATKAWNTVDSGGTFIGNDTPNHVWNGDIDEVSYYSRTLSAAEISDLAHNYGYATSNDQGHVLVRSYSAPEPTTTVGSEQSVLASSGTWQSPAISLGNNLGWGDGSTGTSTALTASVLNVSSTETIEFRIRTATSASGLSSASYISLGVVSNGPTFTLTKAQLDALGLPTGSSEFMQIEFVLSSTDTNTATPQMDNCTVFYQAG